MDCLSTLMRWYLAAFAASLILTSEVKAASTDEQSKVDISNSEESFVGESYILDDKEEYTVDFDRSETWWYDDLEYDDPDYSRVVPEGSTKHTCQEIEPQVLLPDSFTVTMDVTWYEMTQDREYIRRVTIEYDNDDINFEIQYKTETSGIDTGSSFDLNVTVVGDRGVSWR